MWHVYAYESDGSQDAYIAEDLIPISEAEADEIRSQPPSEEYRKKLEEDQKALGGRNSARWPPKEYKEAIGHIAVNSSHLEVTVRTIIWTIAGIDAETGMPFTGNARIGDLLQTLQALVNIKAPGLSDDTRQLCSRINVLFGERSKYIHRIWTVGKNGIPVIGKYFTERSHEKADPQEVTLDQMYDLAEAFMQIEGELGMRILVPFMENRH